RPARTAWLLSWSLVGAWSPLMMLLGGYYPAAAVAFSRCRSPLRNIKTLLEPTHDLAHCQLTLFLLGCARIETRNLPGGGHTIVVIRNDGHMKRAAALRRCAQFSQHQGLELGSCLWRLGRRLVHHLLFLARGVRSTGERARALAAASRGA